MGYKCCVGGCKSGYETEKKNHGTEQSSNSPYATISFFAFPTEKNLREKWTNSCYRQNWSGPTDSSRICHLHFCEEDLIYTGKQRKPRPGAWPRLHPNLPKYFENRTTVRKSVASASNRRDQDNERLVAQVQELVKMDSFQTTSELWEKLQLNEICLPTGFLHIKKENCILFLLLTDCESNPSLLASVSVKNDLNFSTIVSGRSIVNARFGNLL